jgi:hypothetical protein
MKLSVLLRRERKEGEKERRREGGREVVANGISSGHNSTSRSLDATPNVESAKHQREREREMHSVL